MSQSALIALIDERKEKQHIPPLLLRRLWYQKLLMNVPLCVPGVALVPLSVIYVDPERMAALNAQYRGRERVTDVLSFTYLGAGGAISEGEIVLCPFQAIRQRARFSTTIEREFARLFFHGVLHVYGYDHCTAAQKKVMRKIEHCFQNKVRGNFKKNCF